MGRQGRAGDLFKERLKSHRKRVGWSQADLAKQLASKGIDGVYPTTVAKIEAGDRAVRIDELAALADLFGVTVDALLGRNTPKGELEWVFKTLQPLARDTAERIAAVSDTIADELADARYYASFTPEAGGELIAAAERSLVALSDAHRALAALGSVPRPTVRKSQKGRA